MKKSYKKLFSTTLVMSMIISQSSIIFAKEKNSISDKNLKNVVFIYEENLNKNYLNLLTDGKNNKKEILDNKSYELANGIDLAVVRKEENKKLKDNLEKLIENGVEVFILSDNGNIDIISSSDISKELKKFDLEKESKDITRRTKDNEKENKKLKVEVNYKENNNSKKVISIKTSELKDTTSNKTENLSKEENKKEEIKDKEQNKEDSKDEENKEDNNFNNNDVIGKTSTELVGDYYIAGKEESNFANLINDALLKKTGAEIAMTNTGSMLRNIPKGEIKYSDIVESVIFGNTVITKKLTGKQIREAIEVGASIYPESSSTFLHFGNVTYTIDANKNSGNRISDIKVKGKKLDDKKQYIVAMNDYMSTDYNSISGVNTEKNYGELDKIIAEYIKSKGTVNYKKDGRIKIVQKININKEKVKKVVKAIDALTYERTKDNIKAVNNAIKMFNELNQDERKQVTNYKRLIKIADHLRKDGASISKPGSQSSGSSSSSNKPGSSSSNGDKQKSPKTADTSSLMASVSTFMIAATGLGIIRRKK